MNLEFSAVAAGLPMAASFAMAGGFVAFRESRRRVSLNAAMHELRRPLQALSLLLSSGSPAAARFEDTLEMAVAAVEQLDREVNGRAELPTTHRFPVRPIVEAAAERWQPSATHAQRLLRVVWSAGGAEVEGDPIAFAQAVDNMISNGLEHGSGPILLEADVDKGKVRLSVKDEGGVGAPSRSRVFPPNGFTGRSRHGHGLRIVRRVAVQHGGEFSLTRSCSGTEARLILPLSEGRR
jgi:signal transduction histidine kinase